MTNAEWMLKPWIMNKYSDIEIETVKKLLKEGYKWIARGYMLDVKKQYDRVMRDMNNLIEGKCNG